MDSRIQDQLVFEAHRKSTGATYLLWFFLGFLGAHRFYLGRKRTGIAQLLMAITLVGLVPLLVWWLVDAFLIPGMVREENMEVIRKLGDHGPSPADHRIATPPVEPPRKLDPRVEEIRELRRR
ncbi:TM2 domain-containing protein [Aurantiacibacter poecillastricola]|uniref:TM2 domain-containing protein n=1 Tax=Aurantiacibacter poecillastricola TaxID=3064385 RepID=UPI00273D3F50|nr:TM2 domain-containing protein [Aurantiacibacter sp. 219JJ12-13]MDP5262936.1 TM2 domain-containing protein [Aurantiacibacter sp. 219JJ12-13]